MSFHDVAFMPSRATFSTIYLKNCGGDESQGLPHVSKLWLGVSKGMLHVI